MGNSSSGSARLPGEGNGGGIAKSQSKYALLPTFDLRKRKEELMQARDRLQMDIAHLQAEAHRLDQSSQQKLSQLEEDLSDEALKRAHEQEIVIQIEIQQHVLELSSVCLPERRLMLEEDILSRSIMNVDMQWAKTQKKLYEDHSEKLATALLISKQEHEAIRLKVSLELDAQYKALLQNKRKRASNNLASWLSPFKRTKPNDDSEKV